MHDLIDHFNLLFALEGLALGLAVVAVDLALGERRPALPIATAGVVAAFMAAQHSHRWVPWTAAALIALAIAAATELRAPRPDGVTAHHPLDPLTAVLTVASLVGVWSAVPDTEPAMAAGAVLAPMALVRIRNSRVVTPAAWLALCVMVLGATWVGSAGWPSAMAVACAVGLVGTAPIVGRFGALLSLGLLARLTIAHLLVALLLPRILMRRSPMGAWALGLLVLGSVTLYAHRALRTRVTSTSRR